MSMLLFPASDLAFSVALSMLIVPGLSLMGNWSGGLRGLGKPALALFPDTMLRPVLLIVIAIGLGMIRPDLMTATTATLIMTVATLVSALVNYRSFKRSIPAALQQSGKSQMQHKAWLRAALPFTAIGGGQIATRQADLILLGLLVGETEVGLYRIALQGAMLVAFGSQAVNVVLAPRLARLKKAHDTADLAGLLRLSIILSLCVAVPGLLIYVAAGTFILTTLFGAEAHAALIPLIILSAGNTIAMLNGAVIPLLNMTGNENKTLMSFALALTSTIILNLILIPFFGTTGAAIAAFFAIVISSLALRQAAIKGMGIDPPATLFRKGRRTNDNA
jgi:O-antigen/teichoic acid export membrane protein